MKGWNMKCAGIFGKGWVMLAVSFSLVSAPAFADPPDGKGRPHKTEKHVKEKYKKAKKNKKGQEHDVGAVSLVMAGITVPEARHLASEYHHTGYASLPPGIKKNLARGKPLPPGIAKKRVPSGMLSRLPEHAGYEWRIAGTDLILVAVATGMVADGLCGVFR